MERKKCDHRYDDGSTALSFGSKKWCGVYPVKIKVICKKCKKRFEITKQEYEELLEDGDMI